MAELYHLKTNFSRQDLLLPFHIGTAAWNEQNLIQSIKAPLPALQAAGAPLWIGIEGAA